MSLTSISTITLAFQNVLVVLLSLIFIIRWRKPLLELNSFDYSALIVLKVRKRNNYYKLVGFHDGPIVDSIILREVYVAFVF
jgi:hypothetical protein